LERSTAISGSTGLAALGEPIGYVQADDFDKWANPFLLCTFWYIDALGSVGQQAEALPLLNNVWVGATMSDRCRTISIPGPASCGANPQTNSQVGPVRSAMRLSRTSEEGLWHAS